MAKEPPMAEAPMRSARRALLGQIDRAAAALEETKRSDRTIHETRKELKRARASLRLLRECLGDAAYRHDNALLRDVARTLTPVRDAKVLFETLRSNDPHIGAPRPGAFMRRLYRVLGEQRRAAKRELRNPDLVRAGRALRALSRRLGALPERPLGQLPAGTPLKHAYKSARKAFAGARRHRSDESLHECRKQTKYFANELELVLGHGPKRFAKSHKRAHKLAEQLGDDHDLSLLIEKILRHAKGAHAPSQDETVQELLAHLGARRKALQRKGFRLGERLYSSRARRYQL
jgi:CHAD domain-containing protein